MDLSFRGDTDEELGLGARPTAWREILKGFQPVARSSSRGSELRSLPGSGFELARFPGMGVCRCRWFAGVVGPSWIQPPQGEVEDGGEGDPRQIGEEKPAGRRPDAEEAPHG